MGKSHASQYANFGSLLDSYTTSHWLKAVMSSLLLLTQIQIHRHNYITFLIYV